MTTYYELHQQKLVLHCAADIYVLYKLVLSNWYMNWFLSFSENSEDLHFHMARVLIKSSWFMEPWRLIGLFFCLSFSFMTIITFYKYLSHTNMHKIEQYSETRIWVKSSKFKGNIVTNRTIYMSIYIVSEDYTILCIL